MNKLNKQVDEIIRLSCEMQAEAVSNGKTSPRDEVMLELLGIGLINFRTLTEDHYRAARIYTRAGAARLMLECLMDARYIVSHSEEAAEFLSAQRSISASLKNATTIDKQRKMIKSGDLNKIGSFNEKTLDRLRSQLGGNWIGAYNLLCFYTHPSIASISWQDFDDSDKPDILDKWLLYISLSVIQEFLTLLIESEVARTQPFEILDILAEVKATEVGDSLIADIGIV